MIIHFNWGMKTNRPWNWAGEPSSPSNTEYGVACIFDGACTYSFRTSIHIIQACNLINTGNDWERSYYGIRINWQLT